MMRRASVRAIGARPYGPRIRLIQNCEELRSPSRPLSSVYLFTVDFHVYSALLSTANNRPFGGLLKGVLDDSVLDHALGHGDDHFLKASRLVAENLASETCVKVLLLSKLM